MHENYKNMGIRITTRRKNLHITQKALATMLDISSNHLCSIEHGKAVPSFDTFVKLCDVLGVSPNYLLYGSIHYNNISKNLIDSLSLVAPEDLPIIQEIINVYVAKNTEKCNL